MVAFESFDSIILIAENMNEIEITPTVQPLSGSYKLPDDFDYKKSLKEALTEKYLQNGKGLN